MTEKQRVVTMTVIQYDTVGPWKKKKGWHLLMAF